MSKKRYIIPIFVPHRGCPNDCVFCNQKKITGITTDLTEKDVRNIIEEYLMTLPKSNAILEISFFGGSFTAIDFEIQKTFLSIANEYKEKGEIDLIRLSTRPDCIDISILTMLKEHGVDIIELGVQSLDDSVLFASKRGHNAEDVINAVNLIKRYEFKLGIQMMLGLPEDTEEKSIKTAHQIINLAPDFVRIYPTLVVKDTYLEKMYKNEEYNPMGLEDTVNICSKLLMMFLYNNIDVIRIGLQPTENISLHGDVVGGPFHPAIRQLVEGNMFKIIINMFMKEQCISYDEIKILANSEDINNIVGHKKNNIEYFKKKYNIKRIKIFEDSIERYNININIDNKNFEINLREYTKKYLKEEGLM
ncbi:elongator complex protein 3 [Clostridiisalibacter paucivorans]|uniref:elongator complex protein 3 n=1 Tax=Clostridiisalibacter paucivorans TaxID=408753 RepID=UPI00047D9A45|nr:radical SAM protein [Clostridiisalibacter paucivorans]